MTREEASKQITDILEYFEDRIERETDPAFDKEIAKKDAEALRMAIKALEQEPCTDAISRQKAIKQCGFGMTNLLIADCLRKLPPVTPQPKTGNWIPVGERLPEIGTYVLCTVAFKYDKPTIIISKYDAEDYWFNGIVRAWMPLPKPYEPKEYKEKEEWER